MLLKLGHPWLETALIGCWFDSQVSTNCRSVEHSKQLFYLYLFFLHSPGTAQPFQISSEKATILPLFLHVGSACYGQCGKGTQWQIEPIGICFDLKEYSMYTKFSSQKVYDKCKKKAKGKTQSPVFYGQRICTLIREKESHKYKCFILHILSLIPKLSKENS